MGYRVPPRWSLIVVLAALACLGIPGAAAAQGDAANFGVHAGGALAYLTVPKGSSRQMGTAREVGAFGAFPVGWKNMYFRPELAWEHFQSKVEGRTFTEKYMAVPLLVHFEVAGMYLAEGPVLKKALAIDIDGEDVTGNVKNDISLMIVAGIRRRMLGAELRWDQGFRSLQKTLVPGDVYVRNRAITLHAVLSFGGHQ